MTRKIRWFGLLVVGLLVVVGVWFGMVSLYPSWSRTFFRSGMVLLSVTTALFLGFLFVVEQSFSQLLRKQQALEDQANTATETSQHLVLARDEALAAAQANSTFLANMSHEIRTPLHGVIGSASLLVDTPLSAEQRKLVHTIHKSTELLLAVINDVLDFSKLKAGCISLSCHAVNIRDSIEDILDLFAQATWQKGIDLAYRMDHDVPPRIWCDGFRLQQVLINLVGNAVKFTHQGEVVVEVTQGTQLGQICFCVRDTGIGIPETHQHELFKQFYQVDPSASRLFGGTGLGLAISQHLVQLMGGQIQVESVHHQGSRFFFSIPVQSMPPEEGDIEDDSLLYHKQILIVEPQHTSRLCLVAFANSWRMKVWAAATMAEAYSLALPSRLDVVLLASALPDLEQQAQPIFTAYPKTPVLCIVSLPDAYQQANHIASFCRGMLLKPLRRQQIFEVISAVFSGPIQETKKKSTLPRKNWNEELPLRILIAEDNDINQQVIVQIFERLGYTPNVVNHGLEVLQELDKQEYDLLLLDMQMPHLDGPTTAREIIRRFSQRRPYLVAFTANVMPEQREVFEQAGVDDFLEKPIHLVDLMRMLELYVQRKVRQSQTHLQNPEETGSLFHKTPTRLTVVRASLKSLSTLQILSPQPLLELKKLCGENVEKFVNLVHRHIANSKDMVDSMMKAKLQQDREAIRQQAHTLKSTAAMFGGEMVHHICATLEKDAHLESWDTLGSLLTKLQSELDMMHQALNTFLSESAPQPPPRITKTCG